MKNNVSNFCEKKGLPKPLEQAFISYCQSLYASRYEISSDGEAIKSFINKMNQDEIEYAWNQFVLDLKSVLPTVI